jgi:hypothetical protein
VRWLRRRPGWRRASWSEARSSTPWTKRASRARQRSSGP